MAKDGVFQQSLFNKMRYDFLGHWKDLLAINCRQFCEGQRPIYPRSEIIIEKDD
jgi:GH18 family chitinase